MLLDGGGWAEGVSAGERLKSLFIAEQMGKLGYTAVNVATKDLLYGLEALKETARKNNLTLVSSNIVSKSTGEPVFEPFVTREVAGFRIGYVGVVRDNPPITSAAGDTDDLEVKDPAEALAHWVPIARRECDLLVAYAFVGNRKSQALADEVKGIDILVSGGDGFVDQRAVEVGNDEVGRTLICNAGNQGKYLGALVAVVSEHGKVLRYTNTVHGLDKTIVDQPEMLATVEAFKEQLREVRKQEAVEDVVGGTARPTEKFLGSNICSRCHVEAYQVWSQSAHAHSLASLEQNQKERDAACLTCHVTGFGSDHGYQANRADLSNVSCEQCHGLGTLHGAAGFVARPTRETCTGCHDATNSPDFDFDTYWKAIAH